MKNILLLNAISPIVNDVLGANYALLNACDAPDAILVRSADLHATPLPPSLLAIGRAGAGVNNIPVEACSAAGIAVFNTPGANANAVAELVVAALFLSSRDIVAGVNWAQTLRGQGDAVGKLVEKGKSQFVGPELMGKTLGVIGLGAIGALVANAAHALGMRVIGYDPFITVRHAWSLSRAVEQAASMDALLAAADYVTVHIPLSADTRGMADAAFLRRMKPGAALLNFSRGELADNAAVLDALDSGRLRRYVTDFPADRLLGAPGVLAIPHLGASTPESEENCARMAANQLRRFIEQGVVLNSVNLPDVELPVSGAHRVTFIHRNIPNVLNAITAAVSGEKLNIANLVNRSRGAMAYTVLETDSSVTGATLRTFAAVEGIIRVRAIV